MTENNDGTSQNGTRSNTRNGSGAAPPASDDISMEQQNHPPKQSTTDDTTDETINVSRSCLDGVLEQLASRITELEQIRERKKQRVERLSSAAVISQNAPPPIWPQSAAIVAAQNVLGSAAIPTASAGVPANFVPPTPAPKVVPPPPPPPAPDGNNPTGERKQSRYWTADEHDRFLAAIKTCGAKNYVRIAELVGTRNAKQVRTHAQKFQKKLEREEAKRRDDLRRHGGAAAASSVSAAAVAAVAAAAAAMHQGGHLGPDSTGAYPHLLLPYAHHGMPLMMASGGAPPPAPSPATLLRPPDGSSSTNDVSMGQQHAHATEQFVAPETVAAAVAAEAAALGSRLYSQPQQVGTKGDGNDKDKAGATTTNQAVTPTTTTAEVGAETNTTMQAATGAAGSGGRGSPAEAKTTTA